MLSELKELADRILTCEECSGQFLFSAKEQAFFQEMKFDSDPKRCRPCRIAKRERIEDAISRTRVEHQAPCVECGQMATLPFVPRPGRLVYCSGCFSERPR